MLEEKKLHEWTKVLEGYELPCWEELPKLNLYMDQVIILMEEYLRIYKKSNDNLITPSMINNYVKLGVIPKPDKKRYSRTHLAYLIMVCSLKQLLSISMIQKILPLDLKESEVEQIYNDFQEAQKKAFTGVKAQIYAPFQQVMKKENAKFSDYFGASVQVALTGNLYKLISEISVEETEKYVNE